MWLLSMAVDAPHIMILEVQCLLCSDDDDCMEEVQHVLKRIMSQKKATSRKKIAKLEQVCPEAFLECWPLPVIQGACLWPRISHSILKHLLCMLA